MNTKPSPTIESGDASRIQPTYYVRDVEGNYHVADPQPSLALDLMVAAERVSPDLAEQAKRLAANLKPTP